MSITPTSADQMEAITASRRIGRRAALVEKAKGRDSMSRVFWFGLIGLAAFFIIESASNRSLAFAIVGMNVFAIQWARRQVSTRLDAVVELLTDESAKGE